MCLSHRNDINEIEMFHNPKIMFVDQQLVMVYFIKRTRTAPGPSEKADP